MKHLRLEMVLFLVAGSAAAAPTSSSVSSPKIFRDCRDCPQMVLVPSGTFLMGASPSEQGTAPLEQPVHRVNVRSFAAGRFNVTRDEYAAFVRATRRPTIKGCLYTGRSGSLLDQKGTWLSLGFKQTARDPVVCITWKDAGDYARWLSKRTGKDYRLLTEAEWEYAARAGTSTTYYWGAKADRAHVNYGREHGFGKGLAQGKDRWVYTSPVGSFPPNSFGLYDMSGNVLQFVQDCLALSYEKTPRDGSAYEVSTSLNASGDFSDLNGMNSCSFRIARGGDWGDPPEQLRAGFRNFAPDPRFTLEMYRSGGVGFRVARDP